MNYEELVLNNINLVYKVLSDYKMLNHKQIEDYIQIGIIGLIKGAKTYDAEKTMPSTYLMPCIQNELKHEFTNNSRQKRKEPGMISLDYELESGDSIIDTIPGNINVQKEVEHNLQLEKLKYMMDNLLSEDERVFITYKYGLFGKEKLSDKEAAKIVGKTREWCYQLEKRAVNKMNLFQKQHPEEAIMLKDKDFPLWKIKH